MNNQTKDAEDALTWKYANSTGAAIGVGTVLRIAAMFALVAKTIPVGGAEAVVLGGEFEVAKATGLALTQGQYVGWDFANSRVTTDLSGGIFGCVTEAPVTAGTTVLVQLNPPASARKNFIKVLTPSAGDATNGYIDVDMGAAVGTIASPNVSYSFVTYTSAGAPRVLASVTMPSANVLRATITSLAATDRVHVHITWLT